MIIQLPIIVRRDGIVTASVIHVVPDPIRSIDMPSGPIIMSSALIGFMVPAGVIPGIAIESVFGIGMFIPPWTAAVSCTWDESIIGIECAESECVIPGIPTIPGMAPPDVAAVLSCFMCKAESAICVEAGCFFADAVPFFGAAVVFLVVFFFTAVLAFGFFGEGFFFTVLSFIPDIPGIPECWLSAGTGSAAAIANAKPREQIVFLNIERLIDIEARR